MALDPQIAPIVELSRQQGSPHPSEQTADERRRLYRDIAVSLWPNPEEMSEVRDVTMALEGREVRTRLYVPFAESLDVLVVYFHGGSFVVGDLDSHDGLCRRLALDTKCRFLAVDYRLAPEYPFPAAADDATDVTREVIGRLDEFAAPGSKVVVMGDSAGGQLAAIAASEVSGVAAEVLLYPSIGPELLTDSAHRLGTGYLLEVNHLRYDYDQYLRGVTDHSNPRVSLLMNTGLAPAPLAIVVVAEYDPLRDEALAYAGLLEHQGAKVEVLEAEGMVHGFLRLGGVIPDALSIVGDLADHLRTLVG